VAHLVLGAKASRIEKRGYLLTKSLMMPYLYGRFSNRKYLSPS
jgi:hypothetical protein